MAFPKIEAPEVPKPRACNLGEFRRMLESVQLTLDQIKARLVGINCAVPVDIKVTFTPRERVVYDLLHKNFGALVRLRELEDALAGVDGAPRPAASRKKVMTNPESSARAAVHHLRQKLAGEPLLVLTVRNKGYMLIARSL